MASWISVWILVRVWRCAGDQTNDLFFIVMGSVVVRQHNMWRRHGEDKQSEHKKPEDWSAQDEYDAELFSFTKPGLFGEFTALGLLKRRIYTAVADEMTELLSISSGPLLFPSPPLPSTSARAQNDAPHFCPLLCG